MTDVVPFVLEGEIVTGFDAMTTPELRAFIRRSSENMVEAAMELCTRHDRGDDAQVIEFFNSLDWNPSQPLAKELMRKLSELGVSPEVIGAAVGKAPETVRRAVSRMSDSRTPVSESDQTDIDKGDSEPVQSVTVAIQVAPKLLISKVREILTTIQDPEHYQLKTTEKRVLIKALREALAYLEEN